MVENTQGIVELISKKNNAVCISGTWFTLGPLVKMTYVKKGPCEYRTELNQADPQGNPLVVFVRAIGAGQPQGTTQPRPQSFEDSNTHRMSALKFAGNVYQGTAQEDDAKRLAEEANAYLEKGLWVTTEKVGQTTKPATAPANPEPTSEPQYDDAY